MSRCTYCNAEVPRSHFWRRKCKRRLRYEVPLAVLALVALVWAVVGLAGCVSTCDRAAAWSVFRRCVVKTEAPIGWCEDVARDLACKTSAHGRWP